TRDINRTIKIAEHSVVQLFYSIELGLEVSSRAGTHMAFDTRHLRMSGVLRRDELRFHWHVTALTAKIHRLGVLISFITAECRQKKKAHSANREQREDAPVAFARQIDLENAISFVNFCRTTLFAFVQHRAQESECESEDKEKRCNHIREDSNVGILCGSEQIDRE